VASRTSPSRILNPPRFCSFFPFAFRRRTAQHLSHCFSFVPTGWSGLPTPALPRTPGSTLTRCYSPFRISLPPLILSFSWFLLFLVRRRSSSFFPRLNFPLLSLFGLLTARVLEVPEGSTKESKAFQLFLIASSLYIGVPKLRLLFEVGVHENSFFCRAFLARFFFRFPLLGLSSSARSFVLHFFALRSALRLDRPKIIEAPPGIDFTNGFFYSGLFSRSPSLWLPQRQFHPYTGLRGERRGMLLSPPRSIFSSHCVSFSLGALSFFSFFEFPLLFKPDSSPGDTFLIGIALCWPPPLIAPPRSLPGRPP